MKNVIVIEQPGKYEKLLSLSSKESTGELMIVIKALIKGDYELKTITDHLKPKTTGRVEVRGVVKNGARVRVDGLIRIAKGAEEADSFLKMKLLMLDDVSMAMAEPKLEIENNLVKASHSASVGMIDQDQLFYLMSRGVSKKEAEELIVEGFIKVIE